MLILQIAFGIVLGFIFIKLFQYAMQNFGNFFKIALRVSSSIFGVLLAIISIILFFNSATLNIPSGVIPILFIFSCFLIALGFLGLEGFRRYLDTW